MYISTVATIIWLVSILGVGCAWLIAIRRDRARRNRWRDSGRLEGVIHCAVNVLGDRDAALAWLQRPNRSLAGRTPLSLLLDEHGDDEVMTVLDRIHDMWQPTKSLSSSAARAIYH